MNYQGNEEEVWGPGEEGSPEIIPAFGGHFSVLDVSASLNMRTERLGN